MTSAPVPPAEARAALQAAEPHIEFYCDSALDQLAWLKDDIANMDREPDDDDR